MISNLMGMFGLSHSEPVVKTPVNDTVHSSTFTLFKEGFGWADTAYRLSNAFINNCVCNIKQDATAISLLALSILDLINPATSLSDPSLDAGVKTHFLDALNQTDYLYQSIDKRYHFFHANISNGVCGANPGISDNQIDQNFYKIREWDLVDIDSKLIQSAFLYRGRHDSTNSTLEECMKSILDKYNTQLQNGIYAELEKNKTTLWVTIAAVAGSALALSAGAATLAYCIIRKRRRDLERAGEIELGVISPD